MLHSFRPRYVDSSVNSLRENISCRRGEWGLALPISSRKCDRISECRDWEVSNIPYTKIFHVVGKIAFMSRRYVTFEKVFNVRVDVECKHVSWNLEEKYNFEMVARFHPVLVIPIRNACKRRLYTLAEFAISACSIRAALLISRHFPRSNWNLLGEFFIPNWKHSGPCGRKRKAENGLWLFSAIRLFQFSISFWKKLQRDSSLCWPFEN